MREDPHLICAWHGPGQPPPPQNTEPDTPYSCAQLCIAWRVHSHQRHFPCMVHPMDPTSKCSHHVCLHCDTRSDVVGHQAVHMAARVCPGPFGHWCRALACKHIQVEFLHHAPPPPRQVLATAKSILPCSVMAPCCSCALSRFEGQGMPLPCNVLPCGPAVVLLQMLTVVMCAYPWPIA